MFPFLKFILPATLGLFSLVSAESVIVPGATWTDTSGNVIQAHGAGILKVYYSSYLLTTSEVTFVSRLDQLSIGLGKTRRQIAPCSQLCHATR